MGRRENIFTINIFVEFIFLQKTHGNIFSHVFSLLTKHPKYNFSFTRGVQGRGPHHGSSLLENSYIPYECMDAYLSSIGNIFLEMIF